MINWCVLWKLYMGLWLHAAIVYGIVASAPIIR